MPMLKRITPIERLGAAGTRDGDAGGALLPLEVKGLSYEVDDRRLLDDVNLTLDSDAITVVLGPNGAGKSLLLKVLHGLIQPSKGTVTWGGAAMSDGMRKRQAMVFQRPVLLRRTAAANIDFALRLIGRSNGGECQALLARVGLAEKARQPARLLSGGEQQRLALARSLAMKPEILFLDEPTANLDPASVLMIEDLVHETAEGGTKVIFVTHDVAQARRLAEDVVFLHRGTLAEHRPAGDFFDKPESEAAQAFLEGRIVI